MVCVHGQYSCHTCKEGDDCVYDDDDVDYIIDDGHCGDNSGKIIRLEFTLNASF